MACFLLVQGEEPIENPDRCQTYLPEAEARRSAVPQKPQSVGYFETDDPVYSRFTKPHNICKGGRNCRHVELQADVIFVDSKGQRYIAPKGLISDGASIPWIAQPVVGDPFDSDFCRAAFIHDYLYSILVDRAEADAILHEALLADGVPEWRAWLIYRAVRAGGWKAWNNHKEKHDRETEKP